MRSLIVCYSYSGNTRRVAALLGEALRQKGSVDTIELKALDESGNFFAQCLRALRHVKAKIQEANLDLAPYDTVCFGTPVWAFRPAPALNAYLDSCGSAAGKEIILFSTYGSGTGNKGCLDYMQGILEKKGASSFKRFSIQQFKVKENAFVSSEIARLSFGGA